ncbi:MAG: helix-turn-helix transcriptional regulator [Clostridia bacterium]|nr:helix-turn-helix transcriptional regulator [Clostridia bacterium]
MNEMKTTAQLVDISIDNENFGSYLRKVRSLKNISLRQLAKELNITPAYLSDIENSNNKPPDKVLLMRIIELLEVSSYPQVKWNLYDLAAKARNDIPMDVKEYILNNIEILEVIRDIKEKEQTVSELRNLITK